ncbi:glycosyltransferase [Clostridium ganghwense]|uniref:Glycosyltransferase n=1 Tax=Clostridium ganghwense TaxID=312089 RepID=A0ABT4CN78_9CLOT|nr:glycosyltransferase [Clostridium ganghwense]MCY6370500.1 glycosyltransferase [Clostridium ganghwense]
MKNILMVAYYYPPKGGAGVQRTTKFASYLKKFGYNVNVLTVKEEANGLTDKSLNKEIDPQINVYRTDIKETNLLSNLLALRNKRSSKAVSNEESCSNIVVETNSFNYKIKKNLKNLAKKYFLNTYNFIYVPDDKKGWLKYAVDEARKIIKEKDIDIIYTTSSPYTAHMIGYELRKEFSIKWIADFRDPWVANAFVDYGYLTRKRHEGLESRIIKNADKIISVSQPIINEFLERYKNEEKSKFHVITNGYDEKDFCDLSLNASEENDKFTILHNGALYGEKRSPKKIFAAVQNLIDSNKIPKDNIKIKFLGEIGSEHKKVVDFYKSKYPNMIEHKNYVPHEESLKAICRANALLLLIHEGRGTEGIYTGKIFEYIRAGKPIIALVPDGVARELILKTNTGFIAYPSKQDEIEESIYNAYCSFVSSNCSINPDWEEIYKYSRENLTKQLTEAMSEIR